MSSSKMTSRDAKIENFMSQFRDSSTKELTNLTSQQFIEVWRNYDKDGKFLNSYTISAIASIPAISGILSMIIMRLYDDSLRTKLKTMKDILRCLRNNLRLISNYIE